MSTHSRLHQLRPANAPGPWSSQDIHEILRAQIVLARSFGPLDLEYGTTDRDEPWAALTSCDDAEVVAHFARDGGRVIADLSGLARPCEGHTLREAMNRALAKSGLIDQTQERKRAQDNVVVRLFGDAGKMVLALAVLAWEAVSSLANKAQAAFRPNPDDRKAADGQGKDSDQRDPLLQNLRNGSNESRTGEAALVSMTQLLSFLVVTEALARESAGEGDGDSGATGWSTASNGRMTGLIDGEADTDGLDDGILATLFDAAPVQMPQAGDDHAMPALTAASNAGFGLTGQDEFGPALVGEDFIFDAEALALAGDLDANAAFVTDVLTAVAQLRALRIETVEEMRLSFAEALLDRITDMTDHFRFDRAWGIDPDTATRADVMGAAILFASVAETVEDRFDFEITRQDAFYWALQHPDAALKIAQTAIASQALDVDPKTVVALVTVAKVAENHDIAPETVIQIAAASKAYDMAPRTVVRAAQHAEENGMETVEVLDKIQAVREAVMDQAPELAAKITEREEKAEAVKEAVKEAVYDHISEQVEESAAAADGNDPEPLRAAVSGVIEDAEDSVTDVKETITLQREEAIRTVTVSEVIDVAAEKIEEASEVIEAYGLEKSKVIEVAKLADTYGVDAETVIKVVAYNKVRDAIAEKAAAANQAELIASSQTEDMELTPDLAPEADGVEPGSYRIESDPDGDAFSFG